MKKLSGFIFAFISLIAVFSLWTRDSGQKTLNFDPRNSVTTPFCLPDALVAYMRTQAVNLDPAKIIIHMDNQIAMIAFGQLVVLDEYENIRPYLAKKWELSNDGLEYTFTLDPDFRFSNGAPITAEDVVYSFNRLFSKELGSKLGFYYFGNSIKKVQAIDPMTVRFLLNERRASFLLGLTAGAMSILPKEAEFKAKLPTEIISSGPFTIQSFSHDQVILKRNPYHPSFLNLSQFIFRFKRSEICDLLKSKEFDIIDAGPYDATLCENEDYEKTIYSGGNIWFIAFGKNIDSATRRKMIRCADKTTYLAKMREKNTTVTSLDNLFPSRKPIFDHLSSPTDLKDCVFKEKKKLKLSVNTRHHFPEELLSIFQKTENLDIQIKPIQDVEYRNSREIGDFDLLFIEFTGRFSDYNLYASLFHSQNTILKNSYRNSNYDYWVTQLHQAVSAEEKNKAIQNLERTIQSDPPALFIKQHSNIEWSKKSLRLENIGLFYRNIYAIKTRKTSRTCSELKQ